MTYGGGNVIETDCRPSIWDKCKYEAGEEPIVCMKGNDLPIWEWEQFFSGMGGYSIVWNERYWRKRGSNITFRYAVGLMARRGAEIAQTWINDRYSGDWKTAMRAYRNFDDFFDGFCEYFCERRNQFMAKTKEIIDKRSVDIGKIGKIHTSSHGGVANLLKILTKTMHEQGSSIRTIAKVQWSICTQAGIYVPEEFITDVLVADDISPEIWTIDKEKNNG